MPYAPGIQYDGDKYLYRGISEGAKNLRDAIDSYRNDKKEAEFLDGAHEQLAVALQPHVQSGRVTPEDVQKFAKFPGLSVAAKRGVVSQMGTAIQHLDRQQQEAEAAARFQQQNEIAKQYLALQQREYESGQNRSAAGDDRTQRFNELIRQHIGIPGSLPGPSGEVGGPPDPWLGSGRTAAHITQQAILQAAIQSGAATPEMVLKYLPELGSEDGALSGTFDEDPATGYRFYNRGKMSIPSGINPSRQSEPISKYDEEGNLLGHIIPNGKGTGTWKPARAPQQHQDGTEVPGLEGTHIWVKDRAVKRDMAAELIKKLAIGAADSKDQGTKTGAKTLKYNPKTGKVE